jgi:hypothetical protein
MPFIRRTLKAALWGVPGPAIVGCMIALGIGLYGYCHLHLEHDASNTAAAWPWLGLIPITESVIGLIYGVMRRAATAFDGKWRYLNLIHGALIGTCVWSVLASPLLAYGALVAALSAALSLDWHLDLFGLALGVCAGHVACGAVAGFHVEYYLLHGREREDVVS